VVIGTDFYKVAFRGGFVFAKINLPVVNVKADFAFDC
jgi:hypothetical protein